MSPTAANQPGKLTGAIVGVEHVKVPSGNATVDAEVLIMWCAEGMRAVKFSDIQSLRFSNPIIESEFRRTRCAGFEPRFAEEGGAVALRG